MRDLTDEFKKINLFVEVRDARIPITSTNNQLHEILPPHLKRIIVYNKMDLANQKQSMDLIKSIHENSKVRYLHTSTKSNTNINTLLKILGEECPTRFKTVGAWVMIGGIPNIGKSTIINALRAKDPTISNKSSSKSGAKSGAQPCVTKAISGFKIVTDPPMYLVDTPGIIMPKIKDDSEDGLKLSACHAIRDGIVDDMLICDYVLYQLNKHKVWKYASRYSLPYNKPTDDIHILMSAI